MCEVKHRHDYRQDAEVEMGSEQQGEYDGEERRQYPAPQFGVNRWALGIVATVFIAWMGWVSLMLISVDRRVAIIEGNRFDSRDALQHAEADRQMSERVNHHIAQPGHPVLMERVVGMQEANERAHEDIKNMIRAQNIKQETQSRVLREIEHMILDGNGQ